ncbi:hypothetical protein GGR57DRAFT_514103 [Xylariaceae sp. FL1272]|nr:hypothetical protein GGR57DRAFT_514103 [Xylariaceae sp. FL1272]
MASKKDSAVFSGSVGPLVHRCALTKCQRTLSATPQLSRCGGCHLVRYCGPEHQAAHLHLHKRTCDGIKIARARLGVEHHAQRNEADEDTIIRIIAENYGRIDGNDMAFRSLSNNTCSTSYLLENRFGRPGLIDPLPFLFLRLDRDQECFEAVRRTETSSDNDDTDIDTDILADPSCMWKGKQLSSHSRDGVSLNGLVATLLLKLKLLVDVNHLKLARKTIGKYRLPTELRDQIEEYIIRSPVSLSIQRKDTPFLDEISKKLLGHAHILGSKIDYSNPYFMEYLFEMSPSPNHTRERITGTVVGEHHTRVVARRGDLEGCVEAVMHNDEMRRGRSATEVLEDATLKVIWDYLPLAVEDATYLGSSAKQGSERQSGCVKTSGMALGTTWRKRIEPEDLTG